MVVILGVPGTSGLQYTLIEDPGSESGYAVEFSSSGQQGKNRVHQ